MSHEASAWALDQRDVPLAERMVLVLLADAHCRCNGALIDPERLRQDAGVGSLEIAKHLASLEQRGKIARIPHSRRILLGFEFEAAGPLRRTQP